MKELPILFNGPMVRAVLNGTKTQTRRIMNPQPVVPAGASIKLYDETAKHMTRRRGWQVEQPGDYDGHHVVGHLTEGRKQMNIGSMPICAGDQLWVREAWQHHEGGTIYDAAGGVADAFEPETVYRASHPSYPGPWKPSIHMPRWASRITLEVVDVRAERLGDISEGDARAEGVKEVRVSESDFRFLDYTAPEYHLGTARESFFSLWKKVYGTESHDANPLVWVIEFERRNA